jgi:hypothetical protein
MAAFVLGNGVSRQAVDVDQLIKYGWVYGCNALYRTHTPTVLVATDQPIADEIQRSGYSQHNRFYTRRPMPDSGAVAITGRYRGYSSGPNAVAIAAQDDHQTVYLLGFDLGPTEAGKFNNMYADTEFYKKSTDKPTYAGNWQRQLCTVFSDFHLTQFVRVVGSDSADIEVFQTCRNFQQMSMQEFLTQINTAPKDL